MFRRCLRHEEYALDIQVHDISQSFSLNSRASSRRINPALLPGYQYDQTQLPRDPAVLECLNLSQIGGQA